MKLGLVSCVPLEHDTKCHWCAASLTHLKHVFYGIHSKRRYCREICLTRGEERQLYRIEKAAGEVFGGT